MRLNLRDSGGSASAEHPQAPPSMAKRPQVMFLLCMHRCLAGLKQRALTSPPTSQASADTLRNLPRDAKGQVSTAAWPGPKSQATCSTARNGRDRGCTAHRSFLQSYKSLAVCNLSIHTALVSCCLQGLAQHCRRHEGPSRGCCWWWCCSWHIAPTPGVYPRDCSALAAGALLCTQCWLVTAPFL